MTAKQKRQAWAQEAKARAKVMKQIKNTQKGINTFKQSAKAQGIKVKDIKGKAKGYDLNRLVNNKEYARNFTAKQLQGMLNKTVKDLNTLLRPEELQDVLKGKDIASQLSQEEMAQRYAYDNWIKQQTAQVNEYHPDFFDNMSEDEIKATFSNGEVDRSYDWYAKKQAKLKALEEYGI